MAFPLPGRSSRFSAFEIAAALMAVSPPGAGKTNSQGLRSLRSASLSASAICSWMMSIAMSDSQTSCGIPFLVLVPGNRQRCTVEMKLIPSHTADFTDALAGHETEAQDAFGSTPTCRRRQAPATW